MKSTKFVTILRFYNFNSALEFSKALRNQTFKFKEKKTKKKPKKHCHTGLISPGSERRGISDTMHVAGYLQMS